MGVRRLGAVVAFVGLIVLLAQLLRADETDPQEVGVGADFSVVVAVDGSVSARQIDVADMEFSASETITAGPAVAPLVDVRFTTNGVAQLLANGAVRWLGLAEADDTTMFVERAMWDDDNESANDATRLGTAGASVFFSVPDGQSVYFRDPEGALALRRLQPEGSDSAFALGGAAGFLAYAEPNGSLWLFNPPDDVQLVFERPGRPSQAELVDAGTAILMRFRDGAVVGFHVDSGVAYDVWPRRSSDEPAIGVAGTSTRTVVADRAGVLHLVDETESTVLDVPDGLAVSAVSSNGTAATAVLVDGSVVHFGLDPDTVVTRFWDATIDARAAGLVEASSR